MRSIKSAVLHHVYAMSSTTHRGTSPLIFALVHSPARSFYLLNARCASRLTIQHSLFPLSVFGWPVDLQPLRHRSPGPVSYIQPSSQPLVNPSS